jgi:dihydroorotase
MMHVLLRQVRVLDPQSDFHNQVVDIYIENGMIRDIGQGLNVTADTVIEGADLQVSPGFVDIFADYCEPGYEQKETIATGLAAAAAGGFTRVLLAPNTQPPLDSKSAVQYVLRQAQGHAVSLHPLGALSQRIEGKDLAEMLDMHHYGAVAFTDGWKPTQNPNLMLKALEYIKAFGGTIIQIPVEQSLSAGGLMHEGPVSTRLGMAGMPELAETLMVHRDIELLRYTGSKLHISGISSAKSVDMIRKAKEEGLALTCSVTPYHLALTDEALTGYSSLYKVTPPLRSEIDRQALIEGLKDGTIDCIASHHRPQDWDAKAKEFEYASSGMNVQQIAFALAWNAVKDQVSLERVVEAMTSAPRLVRGLGEASIRKDKEAEITIFTPIADTVLTAATNQSASANNPFMEQPLSGRIIGTIRGTYLHLNQ